MQKRKVRLGQEVFVLSATGEVERTMIGQIRAGDKHNNFEPRVTLLNGSGGPFWFSYQGAMNAAQGHTEAQMVALQKRLAALRKKRKQLATEEARQVVMAAPYRVVNLRNDYTRGRTRELKRVIVPTDYPQVGQLVYLAITPQTKPLQNGFQYRPCPHFVLESVVSSVCFSPDGKVHVGLQTPFQGEYFLSRKEAEFALANTNGSPTTTEPFRFISSAIEAAELEKIGDDVPF